MFNRTIELSVKEGCACNNNCIFCEGLSREGYREDYIHPQDSETKKIKLELYKLRLEKAEGVTFTVSGGEPTIRSDIIELLSYANELSYKYINLETNGRIFCYTEFTKKFVKSGCTHVTISLHASNAKLHDEITSASGSFEQTVGGIKNLLTYKDRVKVRIRVLIHKLNYKNLYAIAKFISKEFKGIDEVEFFPADLRGASPRNHKKLTVRLSAVKPHLEKAFNLLKRNESHFLLFHIPFCVVDRKYWENIGYRVVKDGLTTYKPSSPKDCGVCTIFESCNDCIMSEKCPGVWEDYTSWFGTREFKSIRSRLQVTI
ncbi:MAG: radical SAM protein [Candidatus Fermentimicrarchaeum limneticum]|uniref:Radical SAM protein n=1 Tax=Fermentimicrarchaeum limneticum TaxID=2795018 RepID=A0A7D5XIL9_FERL1|nr:MAG: radical SAM protein [Candidatus Fermentimicrarchaeum limneticum]